MFKLIRSHLLHIVRKKLGSLNLWQWVSTVDPSASQILTHESRPGEVCRALLHLSQSHRQDGNLQDVGVKLCLTGDRGDLEGSDQGLLHAPPQLPDQADQHLHLERLWCLVILVPLHHLNSPSPVLNLLSETGVSKNKFKRI